MMTLIFRKFMTLSVTCFMLYVLRQEISCRYQELPTAQNFLTI